MIPLKSGERSICVFQENEKIVLDTNCLLMSLPKISPYRMIWDEFLKGQLILCVSNEIIEEYMEILTQKTNSEILGGRIYG